MYPALSSASHTIYPQALPHTAAWLGSLLWPSLALQDAGVARAPGSGPICSKGLMTSHFFCLFPWIPTHELHRQPDMAPKGGDFAGPGPCLKTSACSGPHSGSGSG